MEYYNSSNKSSSRNDDFALLNEIGYHEGNHLHDKNDGKFHLLRWKSGKSVDPRLLTLLKIFEEVFVERREFFKKIFPGLHLEFEELFKKIGAALSEKKDLGKFQTIQRSVSFDLNRDSSLRLERFKVRTPEVLTEPEQGTTTAQGGNIKTKNSK